MHWTLFAAALSVYAFIGIRSAGAAGARLPATLYPSGSQLTYQPTVSNAEMDFDWGFTCDCHMGSSYVARPRTHSLFHLQRQDQLQRTNGWGQMGTSSQGDRLTQFILYSSRYGGSTNPTGMRWSQMAMNDLGLAARLHGYRPTTLHALRLHFGRKGSTIVMLRRYGTVAVLLLGYEHGNREVEGMVSSTAGLAELQHLCSDLIRQVQIASIAV